METITSQPKSLLKSFSWVAFANIITKPLWALLFIYAARALGAEQFGVYTYGNSLAALLSVFFDLGLDYIAVRSISKEGSRVNNYFNEVLFLRVIVFFLLLVFLLLPLFSYNNPQQSSTNVLILTFLFLTIVLTFFKAIASAFQEFNFFAQMLIWEKVIVIVLGFISLIFSKDLIVFLYSLIAGNIISIVLFYAKLKRKYSLSLILPSLVSLKKLLKEAIPFILLNVFIILYFRIDVMLLDHFSSNKSIVGIYGSIHRLIEMYLLIPTVMMSAAFPIISKNKETNESYTINIANKIIAFQMGLSVFLSIIVGFNSYYINKLLFGSEYLIGAEGLKFIIWATIPLGLNFILGNLLVTVKKERLSAFAVALAACLSIILNLLITPHYSFVGTSIVALVTEMFILLMYSIFTLKYFGKISLLSILFKSAMLIISSAVVFQLYILFLGYNFFISIILLSFVILILLWKFQMVKVAQIKELLNSWNK